MILFVSSFRFRSVISFRLKSCPWLFISGPKGAQRPLYEELRGGQSTSNATTCAATVEFEGRHLPPQAARHYACQGKRYQARRRHVTLFTNSGRLTQHHDAEQMDADSYIENACTQKQNKRRRRWIGRAHAVFSDTLL